MDETPGKTAVSQRMSKIPSRAPAGVESARYRLSVKVDAGVENLKKSSKEEAEAELF
jgi:hypothetical protein